MLVKYLSAITLWELWDVRCGDKYAWEVRCGDKYAKDIYNTRKTINYILFRPNF